MRCSPCRGGGPLARPRVRLPLWLAFVRSFTLDPATCREKAFWMSELISCRVCAGPVSDRAKMCPKCGDPFPTKSKLVWDSIYQFIYGLLFLGVGLVLIKFSNFESGDRDVLKILSQYISSPKVASDALILGVPLTATASLLALVGAIRILSHIKELWGGRQSSGG